MIWFIFALLAGLGSATYSMFAKKFQKQIDKYVLGTGVFFTSGVILLTISLIQGLPPLGPLFFPAGLISGTAAAIMTYLLYKAVDLSDISLVDPIRAISPLFVILISFIFLGELPNTQGYIGISLIVIGSYILNFQKANIGILEPFKQLFTNKASLYMMGFAFLTGISSTFNKILVQNSNYTIGSAYANFVVALIFLFLIQVKTEKKVRHYKKHLKAFLTMGGIAATIFILQNMAYDLQLVSYVISVKRTGALFSIAYGFFMFKEKNIKERLLGAVIMMAGAALIAFA